MPEIAGGVVFAGPVPTTAAVAGDTAVTDPESFDAVTSTTIVDATWVPCPKSSWGVPVSSWMALMMVRGVMPCS